MGKINKKKYLVSLSSPEEGEKHFGLHWRELADIVWKLISMGLPFVWLLHLDTIYFPKVDFFILVHWGWLNDGSKGKFGEKDLDRYQDQGQGWNQDQDQDQDRSEDPDRDPDDDVDSDGYLWV